MNDNKILGIKHALFLGAFFLILGVRAQGKLELLPGSEKMYLDSKTQKHRLIGTVSFRYQGNTMYCDSAHYKEKLKKVWAYGNVHIIKDDINLYCDSLYYSGTLKFARLWGHVQVRDGEYKLTSDSVEYNANTGRAIYRNQGRIENSLNKEIITSKVGYFYPSTGSYFFSGKVKYKKEDLNMTTDTLQFSYEKQTTYFFGPTTIKNDSIEIKCERGVYRVDKQLGQLRNKVEIIQKDRKIFCDTSDYTELNQEFLGRGHVKVIENNEHLTLLGSRFYSTNKLEKSYLTGDALVFDTKQKDTLFIRADTLFMSKDSVENERKIIGQRKVKIYTKELQAIADSAQYTSSSGLLELYQKPILWAKNGELLADTVQAFMKDSLLDHALLTGHARAIMEVDSGLYYNQLAGQKITANFEKNLLKQAIVSGRAWTIYYPLEEIKTDSSLIRKRMGLNRLFASDIKVYLDSGEVTGLTYLEKPDGVFFPMDKIDKTEMFIDNFEWNEALRPKDPWEMSKRIRE